MRRNWQHLLLAFVLAVIAWFFVSGRERVDTWLALPIQLTGMPSDLVIMEGLPSEIDVLVRGPKGLIRSLDEKTLAFSLNLSNLKAGDNVLPVEASSVPLSSNFMVVEINPPRLQLAVERVEERVIAVSPEWTGDLDPDYELVANATEPEFITIRGPKSEIQKIAFARTQAIALDDAQPDLVEQEVGLVLPNQVQAMPGSVKVRLEFGVKTREISLAVPVAAENFSDYQVQSLKPSKVNLHVQMPLPMSRENNLADSVKVVLLIPGALEPGTHTLPVKAMLPEGCVPLKIEPKEVEVALAGVKTTEMVFDVPVAVENHSAHTVAELRPGVVRVKAVVPLPLSREENMASLVTAKVVLDEAVAIGVQRVPVKVVLPEGAELVKSEPVTVEVLVEKKAGVQELPQQMPFLGPNPVPMAETPDGPGVESM